MNALQGWHGFLALAHAVANHPSSRLQKVAIGLRIAARQLHKRVLHRPFWVRWEGSWLQIPIDATSAASAFYFGRFDFWEFSFLEHFLRPGDHVVDVGANVGVYTLFMAGLVGKGGRVIACEPDPINRDRLSINIQRNGFEQVRIVPQAVGERPGTVRFRSGADSVSQVSSNGDLEVEVTTLDGLCADQSPRFIKVDVEGYETFVVRGASTLCQGENPPIWLLEMIPPFPTASRSDLIDLLTAWGYGFYDFDVRSQRLRLADPQRPVGNNLLAVHGNDSLRKTL